MGNPRVPPGQIQTTKWPVLHYGDVPTVDTAKWTFTVGGLVERPFSLSYEAFLALPRKRVVCDIHCVTTWSRLDNTFEGVPVQALLERAGLKPAARYCLVVAEQGFTTNLPLADLNRPDNLIALKWAGEWLTHGYHMHGDPWTEERYGGRGLTQHEINKFRNASKKHGVGS